jgi:uncharacterized membrane protein
MTEPDLKELARAVDDLTRRVAGLEQKLGIAPISTEAADALPAEPTPNLESRLGAQYLNRIGIVALLVGVSFFLHWAFTNGWLGPATLVFLGVVGGLGVLALGRWFLHRKYTAFGLSLEALGVGLLYLVAWAASQLYELVPVPVALGAMIAITAATATSAIVQHSEAAAILACVGGFATPLLLSDGRNQEWEVFAYVLLLTLGMLITLVLRRWQRLMLVTCIGCFAVAVVWYERYYRAADLIETLLFFTIFLAMLIAGPILVGRKSTLCRWPLLVVPPAASLAYVLAANDMLTSDGASLTAFLLGTVLLLLSWRLRDRLRVLYFSTATACVVLAVPAGFDTRWTTSALWLALGTVLIVLGFRRKLTFVRWNALVLLGITAFKILVFDLARLAQGYRIVALASLGIALLAISFLYQRFRVRQD